MKFFCEKTILPGENKGLLTICPALIEINGTTIHSVTRVPKDIDLNKDVRVLKDKMLSPAFIDAHCHMPMSFFRGLNPASFASGNMVEDFFYHVESHLTAEDVTAFTRIGLFEAMSFGTGFIWDHYFFGKAIAQAYIDLGFTGAIAPTLQDLDGPGKNRWEKEWEATEEINKEKKFLDNGVVAAWGPHATDTVSPDLWSKINKQAIIDGLPIHAHLAQSREEYQRIKTRHKKSPVEFLDSFEIFNNPNPKYFAHSIYLDEHDIKIIKQDKNTTLTWCPFAALIFDFPANPEKWEQHNISWTIGTDCVAANDSKNIQKELRYASGFPLQKLSYSNNYSKLDVKKISEEKKLIEKNSQEFRNSSNLLNKVWANSAKHSKINVGEIKAGALANLIVWDLDHPSFWPSDELRSLAFCDTNSAIANLMIKGEWKGEDDNFNRSLFHSSLYKESLKEAKSRLKSLKKRLKK